MVPKFGTYICLWLSYMWAKCQRDQRMCSQVRAVFVFVQKEGRKKKPTMKKTETLVTHISEMAGAIYFKFGMQLPIIGGCFHSKYGVFQEKDHRSMNV